MNKTLKLLIISDIFVFSGFGLIGPILSIFINDHLVGGSITAAGLASAIFIITHAVLQIIFAKIFNPKDRRWMLIVGTFLTILIPFGYIFLTNINQMYLVQFIHGLGASFAYPSWYSLFTSNLEKGKRGLQWSIYSSMVGVGTALTAYAGAWLAEITSFQLVFGLAGAMGVIGLLSIFFIDKKAARKV
ncbi:MAG: MFS transporter [Candidatus Nanoarchaeia archaeon]|nr:MFS transporter [Candidatus Nanoarchaeia archaeon]